jgi:uncharacterized membrane protein
MRLRMTALVAFLASAAAALAIWPRLPARVPTHWGIDGQPDAWGSPLASVLLGPLMVLGVWLAIEFVLRVDPKVHAQRKAAEGEPDAPVALDELRVARETVAGAAVALVAAIGIGVLLLAAGLLRDPGRVVALCIAGFLLVGGNFMGKSAPTG